jgi:hypothetical protein
MPCPRRNWPRIGGLLHGLELSASAQRLVGSSRLVAAKSNLGM